MFIIKHTHHSNKYIPIRQPSSINMPKSLGRRQSSFYFVNQCLQLQADTQHSKSGNFRKSSFGTAQRKVSFDANEDIDVTSRFLKHSSHLPSRSSEKGDSEERNGNGRGSPRRSLSRLSRSGCLRLLDVDTSSSSETCSTNENMALGSTVPSVSEEDMCSESETEAVDATSKSSSSLPSHHTNTDTSCWGHFVEIQLSGKEAHQIRPTKSGYKRRSFLRNSRFTPYFKKKLQIHPNTLPRSKSITAPTDDISTAMNNISLLSLSLSSN